jgi:arylsulfatase A-like enzyme
MNPAALSVTLVQALALIAITASHGVAADSPRRPNIVFIAVDDLNHWVGYTGRNPRAKTPNIDWLSRLGMSFTNAHCAAPLCNPSRAALMSGMRPSTTGCYRNQDDWKKCVPEGMSLPATLKNAGYAVYGAGKIYHGNSFYPSEWDDYEPARGPHSEKAVDPDGGSKGPTKLEGFQTPVTHDLDDADLPDWRIVDYCIEQLERPHDKPLFLACGLHKPHLPWVVPRKYYDMFPLEEIELPPHTEEDLADVPEAGRKFAVANDDHQQIMATGRWKEAIRSYLATIAYADANLGRLLDALQKSRYADNTIICLWGDHGWHLGEKHHWRKSTLWEEATRAPLIWVVPGVTQPGAICHRPVDFMSIYPTLCELAKIAPPQHLEGMSIVPLLADAQSQWSQPAVTTHGFMNHAVRSEGWRYIRYADGSEELYDEHRDPYEWINRAADEALQHRKTELAPFLPKENRRAKR